MAGRSDRFREGRRTIRKIVVLALLTNAVCAPAPKRQWSEGTVTSQLTVWGRAYSFTIDSEGCATRLSACYTFKVEFPSPVRRPTLNVTIHGPIKYAVEKDHIYLLDDDGKEIRMIVTEKTLRGRGYKTPEP